MILLYILIALGLSVLVGTYWLTTVFKDIDHRCKTHARFCYYREFVERDLDLENAVKGLESFPSFLLAALIVSEDAEFFHHKGFNNKELWRCFKLAIKGQELRGGSSITQQLAKMMFTHSKNTLLRKIIETLGTLALERNFSKVEILALYTHFARFWPEVIYGFDQASKKIFKRDLSSISLAEAAFLVFLNPNGRQRFNLTLHHGPDPFNSLRLYDVLFRAQAYLSRHRIPRYLPPVKIAAAFADISSFDPRLLNNRTQQLISIDCIRAIQSISIDLIRSSPHFQEKQLDTFLTATQLQVVQRLQNRLRGFNELKALTEAERTAALNFGMLTILQSPGLSDRREYVLESEEDSLSQGDAQSRALQVCLRAAKNTWNDLSDIYAFSAIVSHWPHDAWDKFYADARSTGYNYQVGYTIQLAHTFFGTKKPTHFVESFLSSKVAVAIFHQLLASLANPDDRIDQKLVAGGG